MALPPDQEKVVLRLERLARWLDEQYETPLGIGVGWDGILGLIPVVGDFATTLMSAYIVLGSAVLGASVPVLVRMALNIFIDDFISVIPVVGWIGDFLWKSNLMNTRLLRAHLENPAGVRRRSTTMLAVILGVLVLSGIAVAVFTGWLTWILLAALFHAVSR